MSFFRTDFSEPRDPDLSPEWQRADKARYQEELAAQTAARGAAWDATEAARIQQHVIVSRHPATIEFLRRELGSAVRVIDGNATAEDVAGKVVAGNIPLHLAARAAEVLSVEFVGTPPRGAEYTAEDMVAAGARLVRYRVEVATGGGRREDR